MNNVENIKTFIDQGKHTTLDVYKFRSFTFVIGFIDLIGIAVANEIIKGLATRYGNILIGSFLIYIFIVCVSKFMSNSFRNRFIYNGIVSIKSAISLGCMSIILLVNKMPNVQYFFMLCLFLPITIYYIKVLWSISKGTYIIRSNSTFASILVFSQLGAVVGFLLSRNILPLFSNNVQDIIVSIVLLLAASLSLCGAINFLKVYYINKYKLNEYC